MNSDAFVTELSKLKESENMTWLKVPVVKAKATARSPERPLLELYSEYDVSGLECGYIVFCRSLSDHNGMIVFARVDIDALAICEESGKIYWIAGDCTGEVRACVAKSEGAFLESVIEAMVAWRAHMPPSVIVDRAVSAAGESGARDLFEMSFG
jgi:hypothetical protein